MKLVSVHRGKIELILLAYGLSKENVTAIMILYENTNVKVHLPNKDTDFLDIVAVVLPGDTLSSYLSIICVDFVNQTSTDLMERNGLL